MKLKITLSMIFILLMIIYILMFIVTVNTRKDNNLQCTVPHCTADEQTGKIIRMNEFIRRLK